MCPYNNLYLPGSRELPCSMLGSHIVTSSHHCDIAPAFHAFKPLYLLLGLRPATASRLSKLSRDCLGWIFYDVPVPFAGAIALGDRENNKNFSPTNLEIHPFQTTFSLMFDYIRHQEKPP